MSDPQEAATPSDPHSAEALDLDAIQKRADAATAGSWWTGMKDGFSYTVEGPEADSHPVAQRLIRPDAEFIVHAREDVPALVAALRSRDAEVAELKAKIANAWPKSEWGIASDVDHIGSATSWGVDEAGARHRASKYRDYVVVKRLYGQGDDAWAVVCDHYEDCPHPAVAGSKYCGDHDQASSPVEGHDSTCDGLDGCQNPAAHTSLVEGGN